jgi:hypothetical protein
MRSPPDGLDVSSVIEALRDGWEFEVDVAEYAAIGAGSYHWHVADTTGRRGFVTVDDLGQKAWLGDTHDESFDGLRAAFDTAVALRESGLRFVVAPFPTLRGASLLRLDPRYAIALFPSVDGTSGEWGRFGSDADRLGVVRMLAELHQGTRAVGSTVRATGFDLPGRQHIEGALAELNEEWTGGPLSEPARRAVTASASELAELLALGDRLAADAQLRSGAWVVTHGEPHPGNVMRSSEGQHLVDWDTVALGPPERDLWMLVDEGDDAAAVYARATGTPLDDTALDFFRVTWDLKDIAEYIQILRSVHEENDDTVRQYRSLTRCADVREAWAARL